MSKRKKRSKLEERVGDVLEPLGFTYETADFEYSIPKKYLADFSYGCFHVEVKGWFRPGDRQKYKAVRKAMADRGEFLVFLLQSPNKKCSKANKITMAEWCEKEDIPWFDDPEKLAWYVLGKDMVTE